MLLPYTPAPALVGFADENGLTLAVLALPADPTQEAQALEELAGLGESADDADPLWDVRVGLA